MLILQCGLFRRRTHQNIFYISYQDILLCQINRMFLFSVLVDVDDLVDYLVECHEEEGSLIV